MINNIKKKKLFNLIIILLSSIITLIFCELFLYFSNNVKFNLKQSLSNTNIIKDKRNIYEFYVDEKKIYVPRMFTMDLIKFDKKKKMSLFPLSGFSNSQTITCNELGDYKIIKSDKHGFFNQNDRYKKNIEAILIGDSFGMGDCVESKDLISEFLSKENIETLNLSYGNTSTLIQYAILIEFGFELNPKNIIWLYYDNDIDDLNEEINSITLRSYLFENKKYNLINKEHKKEAFLNELLKQNINNHFINQNSNKEINKKDEKKKKERLNPLYFQNLARLIKEISTYRYNFIVSDKDKKSLNIYETILTKSKEKIESFGGKIYFVLIPDSERFKSVRFQNATKNKGRVIKILKKLDIEYLDGYESINKNFKNPLLLYPLNKKDHFNSKGYNFMSKEIIKMINQP